MRVHDAAPGRDAVVEHALHDAALIERRLQPHAVALPVGARPRRLRCGGNDAGNAARAAARTRPPARGAARRSPAAASAARGRSPPGCRSSGSCKPRLGYSSNTTLRRGVADRVGHAHAMLTQQPELAIELGVRRREHPAVAGREQLARVKREAGDVAVRPADALPPAVPEDLAADGARRVLDDRQAAAAARARRSRRGRTACRAGARTRIAFVRGRQRRLDAAPDRC